ncbi:uncharacterized protein LOC131229755 [Magnolia sinica]|uniref:uncharacterized protein LOC131229755 n=1 Tax=Magnolia sinica TaxID=86752 RepID=UPI0026597714|nr:uncharacterized protein LOC131229755 [Magnolia sinica]
MWLVYICNEEEKVLGTEKAPGSCPYRGGIVQAMDVESQQTFCFLPICFKTKRKYHCTLCSKRLVLYP